MYEILGIVGKQGVLHDPTCQSVKQLQKMLFSLLKRAHSSPEGLKEAIYHIPIVILHICSILIFMCGNLERTIVILFQGSLACTLPL